MNFAKNLIAASLCLIMPCAAIPCTALAGIEVDPIIKIFEPKDPLETIITVTNADPKLSFVTVQAREVMAPGEEDEKLRLDPDPASMGILVTPLRLAMEPGERRGLRLLAVNPAGPTDRVWRTKIAPAAGKVKSQQSGVAFLIAYDALIIQRAVNPVVTITGKRDDKSLTLANSGNSFGLISEVNHCLADKPCVKLPFSKRLYGGKTYVVPLPEEKGRIEVTVVGLNAKKDVLIF
jgi:hypothetical protein